MTENFPGPMAGKTALVTGGTGGIGRATAACLAAPGARVGITGRDKARTHAAATGIVRESGNPAVDAFAAGMSCQAGARALAVAVRSAYPRLDVLASNVGGFWATRHLTADGLERTFAVSHLAAFLLTGLVLDRLKGSAPARIVTVSSNAQAAGRLNFDDLQGERSYSGQRAYICHPPVLHRPPLTACIHRSTTGTVTERHPRYTERCANRLGGRRLKLDHGTDCPHQGVLYDCDCRAAGFMLSVTPDGGWLRTEGGRRNDR